MNVIINKLPLPCDILYTINSFCYNDLGYTFVDIQEIDKCKQKFQFQMKRVKIELYYWKSIGTSIGWLKPLRNGTCKGAYLNKKHETCEIRRAYQENRF
jgi:hypothetical protein